MNTTPIYFDSDITLADLAQAIQSIGCRLEIGDHAEIHVARATKAIAFEPVADDLPTISVEDLEYDLPAWLRRAAE